MDPKRSVSVRMTIAAIPPDVMITLESLIRLCNTHKILFSGMMIRLNEPSFVTTVGNAVEKGSDQAELFRQFAQIVEDAVTVDKFETHEISKPN